MVVNALKKVVSTKFNPKSNTITDINVVILPKKVTIKKGSGLLGET